MGTRSGAKRPRANTPKKKRGARLGQHFLTAPWAASALVAAVRIEADVPVLEIGPGTGNLTKELLRTGAHVLAVEKDPLLIDTLHARFSSEIASKQLTILNEDIRNFSPESAGLRAGEYVLAANIPYYITGDIIRTFLTSKNHPARMALLVQKEVAVRIARDKKESILSLSVKVYGTPKYVKTVGKGCFSPPPSVDSAILLVDDISRSQFTQVSEERFFSVVKTAFASKRKMLGGNLKNIVHLDRFHACNISPQARAESLPLEKWLCLSKEA
ncbi:MAG: ribosomal RNA small subunit methyltransferase A [Candidatus Pacebacteria bacterium]|nr:ribosomal RNA small subunit methyltransferase A [Candidatus Paceibacterota bacterium]